MSHARGIGSLFTMVPVASPSPMTAPEALLKVNVNVSSTSSVASSSTGTFTDCSTTPAAKVSVPEAAV